MLFFSCRKNPPQDILPVKTHSGEHTLGFFINGEAWIPYDRGNHEIFELPKAQLDENGALKIAATRIDDRNSARNWFCIEIAYGCLGKGIYELSNEVCTSPYQTFYYADNKERPGEHFAIDTTQPHFIEIEHMDTSQQHISGIFEFTATSNLGDQGRVSFGRFDLLYE